MVILKDFLKKLEEVSGTDNILIIPKEEVFHIEIKDLGKFHFCFIANIRMNTEESDDKFLYKIVNSFDHNEVITSGFKEEKEVLSIVRYYL